MLLLILFFNYLFNKKFYFDEQASKVNFVLTFLMILIWNTGNIFFVSKKFIFCSILQGTEVKAITYSNMQIHTGEDKDKHEIFVIIDI